MMNWRRKKTFQTTSLMSNVSLKKLVLKFKKMKDGDEPESKITQFHNLMNKDEDLLYNSDYRLNVSPVSSSSFKKMVSNGRTMKELVSEEQRFERAKTKSLKVKEQNSRKWRVDSTEEVKNIVFETKSDNIIQAASEEYQKSRRRSRGLDSEDWQKLKNKKINEIMLKNEQPKKCVDMSKDTNRKKSKLGCKVNAYTPRTLSRMECRIKALEDIKRTTRMKMKKEREMKDAFRAYVDSFAILKSSFNPQQDFRDSMMEMIIENGIRQRRDLEELLACYLTLNCDEYHNLIVKVFKDVWLELTQVDFDPQL